MTQWYFKATALLREMQRKAFDARARLAEGDANGAKLINTYLMADFDALADIWKEQGFPGSDFGGLGRHIHFGMLHDYDDILHQDLDRVHTSAEDRLRESIGEAPEVGFDRLLHPLVREHALHHYTNQHYRDAVLNSIVAIFDLIRQRTGFDLDGSALVSETFSLEKPHLVFSDLITDSGRNDQKGFLQILMGTYLGIRNPKAHSLQHDLDAHKAAQYLVFASLLIRRVEEAVKIKAPPAKNAKTRK